VASELSKKECTELCNISFFVLKTYFYAKCIPK